MSDSLPDWMRRPPDQASSVRASSLYSSSRQPSVSLVNRQPDPLDSWSYHNKKPPAKVKAELDNSSLHNKKLPEKVKADPYLSKYPFKTIEIAPGHYMRLRGAQETTDAIMRDAFVPFECFICNETVFCIDDADFILCPICKVVSPLNSDESKTSEQKRDPSVGLGFTLQCLFETRGDY